MRDNDDDDESGTVECEVMPADASTDVFPAGSLERSAAKEKIRLAFMSGVGTLAALSIKERVPYQTVLRWSKEERWGDSKREVATISGQKTTENVADWIAEQRTVQIKGAITRARKLQAAIDRTMPEGAVLEPSELQAIASAEEKADNIVRRNLGMDQQNQSGAAVSINILAGGIQVA
jgi:hypothetical protein